MKCEDGGMPYWICACAIRYCGASGDEQGDDAPEKCPRCGGPVLVHDPQPPSEDGLPF